MVKQLETQTHREIIAPDSDGQPMAYNIMSGSIGVIRWGDGEIRRFGDGEIRRWGDSEMGKSINIRHLRKRGNRERLTGNRKKE